MIFPGLGRKNLKYCCFDKTMNVNRKLMRSFHGVVVFLCATSAIVGQTQRSIDFQPIDAEWSRALQSIILIAPGATSQLRILDPATNTQNSVTLLSNPTSLSVSQDGRTAAVGHDGSISYVDLITRTVTRTITVTGVVEDLVLATEWIHAKPVGSIRISSGEISPFTLTHFSGPKLSADGSAIYATESAANSTLLWRYNIAGGPITSAIDSSARRTSVVYPACDGAWPSPDGSRIYTGCATAFEQAGTISPAGQTDMRYATSFPEMSGIRAVAELPSRKWTAALASTRGGKAAENEVFLFDSTHLAFLYHFVLPDFASSGSTYAARGRWIFMADNFDLYAVSEAAAGFPGANTFGVATIALPDISGAMRSNPACNPEPAFSKESVTSIFYGDIIQFDVIAAPGCFWNITIPEADASWIHLNKPGFGSGSRTFLIRTAARVGPQRSTTLQMGTRTLAVTQSGFAPPTAPVRLNVKFVAADFSQCVGEMVILGSDPPRIMRHQATLISNQELPVPRVPLALALDRSADVYANINLNGTRAAVAQDGWISFYHVGAGPLGYSFGWEKDLKVPTNPHKMAWAANGYLYAFSGTDLFSIHEASGNWQVLTVAREPKKVTLNRNSTVLYADDMRFDISGGAAVLAPAVQTGVCAGPRWLAAKGGAMIDSCGGVSSATTSTATDQRPISTLSNAPRGVVAAAYTPTYPASLVLAIGDAVPGEATELQTYDEAFRFTGSLGLPGFTSLTAPYGVDVYKWYGRSVHYWEPTNGISTPSPQGIVVVQASPSANLIADHGLYVPPGVYSGNPDCPTGIVDITALEFSGTSGAGDISVAIPKECWWYAYTRDSWIKFPERRLLVGPGSIHFTVDSNTTGQTRTGLIWVADAAIGIGSASASKSAPGHPIPQIGVNSTITITQAAGNVSAVVSPQSTTLSSSAAASFTVTVTFAGSWVVQSNSSWLTVTNGTGRTGNGTVTITAAQNYSIASRNGTLTMAGVVYNVTQAGQTGLQFYPVTPCRVADTRNVPGPLGQPVVAGGTERSFPVLASACGIPSTAQAYSLNVTIVPKEGLGYLTLFPTGTPRPFVSTMNSLDGRVKANAALVPAGVGGAVSVFVTNTTEVVLDINGYFAPPTQQPNDGGLLFYPIAPCRVLDTRNPTGPQGGPQLAGLSSRTVTVAGYCSIPAAAKAYSTSLTAVPKRVLTYLTLWPSGTAQPFVSSLNAQTGSVTANAAIAVASGTGSIDVFATDDTHLLIDVNGYFAPPASGSGGLKFYPLEPCRVSDSRNAVGPFGGPQYAALETRSYAVKASGCGEMTTAKAYSVNATVVPVPAGAVFGYLTMWPSGTARPVVSTLNAIDGAITSNAAIVPAGVTNGEGISLFGTEAAHLFFDINGYFAP
jgi:hypothetical protein